MLDSFLKVACDRSKRAEDQDRLVDKMRGLPDDYLHKLASGEEKLAYLSDCGFDGQSWLEKFKGTPLFAQAIELEKQDLQQRMADKAHWREEEAARGAQNAARDELGIQKKLLEIQLAEAEEGGQEGALEEAAIAQGQGGAEMPEEVPEEVLEEPEAAPIAAAPEAPAAQPKVDVKVAAARMRMKLAADGMNPVKARSKLRGDIDSAVNRYDIDPDEVEAGVPVVYDRLSERHGNLQSKADWASKHPILNTMKGVVPGGALGALAGGAVGSHFGRPGMGALVAGGLGAMAGGAMAPSPEDRALQASDYGSAIGAVNLPQATMLSALRRRADMEHERQKEVAEAGASQMNQYNVNDKYAAAGALKSVGRTLSNFGSTLSGSKAREAGVMASQHKAQANNLRKIVNDPAAQTMYQTTEKKVQQSIPRYEKARMKADAVAKRETSRTNLARGSLATGVVGAGGLAALSGETKAAGVERYKRLLKNFDKSEGHTKAYTDAVAKLNRRDAKYRVQHGEVYKREGLENYTRAALSPAIVKNSSATLRPEELQKVAVSDAWIKKMVTSGVTKNRARRRGHDVNEFIRRMEDIGGKKRQVAHKAAVKAQDRAPEYGSTGSTVADNVRHHARQVVQGASVGGGAVASGIGVARAMGALPKKQSDEAQEKNDSAEKLQKAANARFVKEAIGLGMLGKAVMGAGSRVLGAGKKTYTASRGFGGGVGDAAKMGLGAMRGTAGQAASTVGRAATSYAKANPLQAAGIAGGVGLAGGYAAG